MQELNIDSLDGKIYTVDIDLPETNGEYGESSVVISNRDFVMQQIMHCVVGDDGSDPEQYSLDWSKQNEYRYWKGTSAPMAKTYGSVKTNIWSPEPIPVTLVQQTTLYVRCTNKYPGTPVARKLQILFKGIEKKDRAN